MKLYTCIFVYIWSRFPSYGQLVTVLNFSGAGFQNKEMLVGSVQSTIGFSLSLVPVSIRNKIHIFHKVHSPNRLCNVSRLLALILFRYAS